MNRRHACLLAWAVLLISGERLSAEPAAVMAPPLAPPTDWRAWRERQRRELAELARPADPPGEIAAHPVDRFLIAWWQREQITPLPLCDDAAFVRRAWLDTVGLLPNELEVRAFLQDQRPDRRERLVDRLLSEDPAYAEGWMAWWCDLLRNDEQTNIDDLRKPVTRWLLKALLENRPYDRLVAELLNPGPGGPDGYLKGINWRGIVNASQSPPMQAAQNVGQVFMGTNIKCASCHDHFTRPYMLEETYGLASFFSEQNLAVHRCDKPTGAVAAPVFILPGLGQVQPDANLAQRRAAVAEMVTTPRNPRFARTMVNRLWKRLMGRGLVEPADDFHAKPANPELLDWLAYDFMVHDYDLKHTIRLLMISRAYQLQSVTETADQFREARKQSPVYIGPPPRRLTSEQFLDGVACLTGYWPEVKTMAVEVANPHIRAWRHKIPDELARAMGRPSREQVCTERVEDPSMLQMLEMVNGQELAGRMAEGARRLLSSPLGQEEPATVLEVLFIRAFTRIPTASERQLLAPLLGRPDQTMEARQAGWEDVCWMMVMSPEFQYVQ